MRPLPPHLSGRAFSVGEALSDGVGRQRLRASDLSAPFHGVRSPGAPQSIHELCLAYARVMPEGSFFSHETAARLWDVPLPTGDPTVHVSVVAPAHPPQGRGVTGHRLSAAVPVVDRRGVRVARASVAWMQLAASLSLDDLVVAGDHLVRRRAPLASLDELREVAAAAGHGRGVRVARTALGLIRPGTDSPMETRLRLLIVSAGLPEPVIGYTVRDANGDFVATPDLVYVKERIAIEYEGDIHRTDRYTFMSDITRRELLQDAGWHVIRVVAAHLRQPHWLVSRIARSLAERG